MLDIGVLNIFPEGALASSVTTTVWIGVWVVAMFNLRLGWVFSGLVVPGYLVPLLLVKPEAAAVVVGEGILTYAVVWFYSEYLSARLGWSNLFGRDRFFILVLASVGVRVVCDGWLLPMLGEYLNSQWQLNFDYRNSLHSFGLIIVSLIANNFWKTGFRRGVLPLVVTVGITTLIVRYGLMEFTNFRISSVAYLYDDLATSILASPKAYIILLVTAFVASRMNLLYGWDFSGILIPSLLALQWYQPSKIVVTFVEAFVILLLSDLVLRLPMFQRMTMEGARKILLFFNVGFAWKLALGYALIHFAPQVKVSDYYGFGYLLPTLIAAKMHDKAIVARMSRALLQTSVVSALIATLIGFALSLLPDPWNWLASPAGSARADAKPDAWTDEQTGVLAQLRSDHMALIRQRIKVDMPQPLPQEADQFTAALKLLTTAKDASSPQVQRAAQLLAGLNYSLSRREGRYLMLRENAPARRHWGSYVIDLQAPHALSVEVPAPFDERGTLESAFGIFSHQGARTLAVAGAPRRLNKDGGSDVLLNPGTLYQRFHQVFGQRNVIQVRSSGADLPFAAGAASEPADADAAAVLRVKGQLPPDFSLTRFKALVDAYQIDWRASDNRNLQRQTTADGFVEMELGAQSMRRIQARSLAAQLPAAEAEVEVPQLEGNLASWLARLEQTMPPAGSQAYSVPLPEDLLYVDNEIITPLLAAAAHHRQGQGWSARGLADLQVIQQAASAIGYELLRYRDLGSGDDFVLLHEPPGGSTPRHWGSYVLRLGGGQSFAIQVPRPLGDADSLPFGIEQFMRLRARWLSVAGSHPLANADYSADVTRRLNKGNVFNAVSQALVRERGDAPWLTLQVRSMALAPDARPPAADVLLAFDRGLVNVDQAQGLARELMGHFKQSGYSWALAGGGAETAGYEASGLAAAPYLSASPGKAFAVAWLSPAAQVLLRGQHGATAQAMQFAALRIPSQEVDLRRWLAEQHRSPQPLPAAVHAQLEAYANGRDIVQLRQAAHTAAQPQNALRLLRLVDLSSRQGHLAVLDAQGRWLAVTRLDGRAAPASAANGAPNTAPSAAAFTQGRAAWLLAAPTVREGDTP